MRMECRYITGEKRCGCNGIGQTGLWIMDGGGKRQDEVMKLLGSHVTVLYSHSLCSGCLVAMKVISLSLWKLYSFHKLNRAV